MHGCIYLSQALGHVMSNPRAYPNGGQAGRILSCALERRTHTHACVDRDEMTTERASSMGGDAIPAELPCSSGPAIIAGCQLSVI